MADDEGTNDQGSEGASDDHGSQGDEWNEERARRTIEAQRRAEKESKARIRQLEQERDALATEKADRERQELTELEREKALRAEAESKATAAEERARVALSKSSVKLAATKAGAANPDVVYRLLDLDDLTYGDDGEPTNADTLVEALLKAEPYLLATSNGGSSGPPATPPPGKKPSKDERIARGREELTRSGLYPTL